MAPFPQQLGEALAGALGEPLATAIPAADQMGHRFGGRHGRAPSTSLAQGFKRLAHHLGPVAATLPREPVEKGRRARIDPDIERTHERFCITVCNTALVDLTGIAVTCQRRIPQPRVHPRMSDVSLVLTREDLLAERVCDVSVTRGGGVGGTLTEVPPMGRVVSWARRRLASGCS